MSKEQLRSSERWLHDEKIKCKIEDHSNGWDKKNFAVSWFKEKISRVEFYQRFNRAKVFHKYRSNSMDHCSCSFAQYKIKDQLNRGDNVPHIYSTTRKVDSSHFS